MTTPWRLPDFDAHEALHFVTDRASGLCAIIAVHSTHLGPAAGGCRFWHYADDGEATYVWDMRVDYVTPNTLVTYQWRAIEGEDVEVSEEGTIRYEDLPLRSKSGARREVEFVSNIY